MAYERPGVYVSESTFTTNIQTNTGITAAAFLGLAERGPTTTPALVTSWNQYTSLFGALNNTYHLGYAVYQFFANGGQQAYVCRVVDSSAVVATSTLQGTPSGGSAADIWVLKAKSVGVWGNSLTVNYTFDTTTLTTHLSAPKFTKNTLFTITVSVGGTQVEEWSNVSVDPENNRYITTVLDLYSSYITTQSVATVAVGVELVIGGMTVGDYEVSGVFASGSEGNGAIDSADWTTASNTYDTIPQSLIFNLVGQTDSTIVNNGIAKMVTRGNSFLVVDTPLGALTKSALSSAVASYTQSSYAAIYGPALKMYDPTKTGAAAIRTTFPGGAVVGAMVRSEVSRGVAKAPAGYGLDLRNVFGLVANLTEAEQGSLYKTEQMNVFSIVPGVGAIINGARTQQRNASTKFITVRRSLNFLKQALKDSTAYALFEPNDARLYEDLTVRITSLLTTFWGSGGLKGKTTGEAFYVVCNSSNNSEQSVENGIVNIQVGVALQTPAEFIVINISQFTGGSTATSI